MENKKNQNSYKRIIDKSKESQERVTVLDVIMDSENYPIEFFPEHLQEGITSVRQMLNKPRKEQTSEKNNGPTRIRKP